MKMVKAMSVLACCAGLTLVAAGCHSDQKKASAGAVSDKAACCQDKGGKECTDSKATTTKGSMGAVGAKSGCCSGETKKSN